MLSTVNINPRDKRLLGCVSGQKIGSLQNFTVSCGVSPNATAIFSSVTQGLAACVDSCSNYHGALCTAVSFDGAQCLLYSQAEPGLAQNSSRDAAIAIPSASSSNCNAIPNANAMVGGVNYDFSCGHVIDGSDRNQLHAPRFVDCLGQCNTSPGCVAVSYDRAQLLGFNNCYLKTAAPAGQLIVDSDTDSAAIVSGGSQDSGVEDPSSSTPAGEALPAETSTAPGDGDGGVQGFGFFRGDEAPVRLQPAVIVAIALGNVLALVLIAILLMYYLKRRQRRSRSNRSLKDEGRSTPTSPPMTPQRALRGGQGKSSFWSKIPSLMLFAGQTSKASKSTAASSSTARSRRRAVAIPKSPADDADDDFGNHVRIRSMQIGESAFSSGEALAAAAAASMTTTTASKPEQPTALYTMARGSDGHLQRVSREREEVSKPHPLRLNSTKLM